MEINKMEIKEFIGTTIEYLVNLPSNDQVAVFNEIKFALLDYRKNKYESNLKTIDDCNNMNKEISIGNESINGNPSNMVTMNAGNVGVKIASY